MPKMIAFCGLCCTDCPTFIATKNDDDVARAKTAAMYNQKYGFAMTPDDINCDGCHSVDGKLISYCENCAVRKCGLKKGLKNCTFCNDQPCEILNHFHAFSPDAKACYEAVLKRKRTCKKAV
jgi:hypothetical protein